MVPLNAQMVQISQPNLCPFTFFSQILSTAEPQKILEYKFFVWAATLEHFVLKKVFHLAHFSQTANLVFGKACKLKTKI